MKTNAQGQKVGCNCEFVHERVLEKNFLAVLNGVIENKDMVVADLRDSVRHAIDNSPNKTAELEQVGADKITLRKSKLIEMCVDGLITRTEFEKANNQYTKQFIALNKQFTALEGENSLAENLQEKFDRIEQTIENLVKLKEFGESICGEVLAKVVI